REDLKIYQHERQKVRKAKLSSRNWYQKHKDDDDFKEKRKDYYTNRRLELRKLLGKTTNIYKGKKTETKKTNGDKDKKVETKKTNGDKDKKVETKKTNGDKDKKVETKKTNGDKEKK